MQEPVRQAGAFDHDMVGELSFNVSASERAAVSTFIDGTQEWPPTKEE